VELNHDEQVGAVKCVEEGDQRLWKKTRVSCIRLILHVHIGNIGSHLKSPHRFWCAVAGLSFVRINKMVRND